LVGRSYLLSNPPHLCQQNFVNLVSDIQGTAQVTEPFTALKTVNFSIFINDECRQSFEKNTYTRFDMCKNSDVTKLHIEEKSMEGGWMRLHLERYMLSNARSAMKYVLLSLCVLSFSCPPILSQKSPSKRGPDTATTRARLEEERLRRLNSERTPAPKVDSQRATIAQLQAAANDDFIIGPEDVLEIKVWREPDLATKAIVRPDGKISVTLLGDVQASGLTTTQLSSFITKELSRFVVEPEVSVVVNEIHSRLVHLIGAVNRPGAYALTAPLTVVELLSRAGGLAETAKNEDITVVRIESDKTFRIPFNYKSFIEGKDLGSNIPLKNGDVVLVH